MSAESGSPATAPSPLRPCPRHKTTDDIRRVSVVYADVYAGGTADLLSPRPVLKAADRLAWTGTGFGVAGMAAIWAGTVTGGGARTPALVGGIICFAYALAMYGWAAARRARLTRVERGIPAALELWRSAWYCERCDGVFFDPGTEGRLLSAGEFRRLVWSAGGYGDLQAAGG